MTLQQALGHYPTRRALARAAGVRPETISRWSRKGVIPYAKQCILEVVTDGALKADRT